MWESWKPYYQQKFFQWSIAFYWNLFFLPLAQTFFQLALTFSLTFSVAYWCSLIFILVIWVSARSLVFLQTLSTKDLVELGWKSNNKGVLHSQCSELIGIIPASQVIVGNFITQNQVRDIYVFQDVDSNGHSTLARHDLPSPYTTNCLARHAISGPSWDGFLPGNRA